jgi:hypothetical protein
MDDKHGEGGVGEGMRGRHCCANYNLLWDKFGGSVCESRCMATKLENCWGEHLVFNNICLDYFFSPEGYNKERWSPTFFTHILPWFRTSGHLAANGAVWLPGFGHVKEMLKEHAHVLQVHFTWTGVTDPLDNPLYKSTENCNELLQKCKEPLINSNQLKGLPDQEYPFYRLIPVPCGTVEAGTAKYLDPPYCQESDGDVFTGDELVVNYANTGDYSVLRSEMTKKILNQPPGKQASMRYANEAIIAKLVKCESVEDVDAAVTHSKRMLTFFHFCNMGSPDPLKINPYIDFSAGTHAGTVKTVKQMVTVGGLDTESHVLILGSGMWFEAIILRILGIKCSLLELENCMLNQMSMLAFIAKNPDLVNAYPWVFAVDFFAISIENITPDLLRGVTCLYSAIGCHALYHNAIRAAVKVDTIKTMFWMTEDNRIDTDISEYLHFCNFAERVPFFIIQLWTRGTRRVSVFKKGAVVTDRVQLRSGSEYVQKISEGSDLPYFSGVAREEIEYILRSGKSSLPRNPLQEKLLVIFTENQTDPEQGICSAMTYSVAPILTHSYYSSTHSYSILTHSYSLTHARSLILTHLYSLTHSHSLILAHSY